MVTVALFTSMLPLKFRQGKGKETADQLLPYFNPHVWSLVVQRIVHELMVTISSRPSACIFLYKTLVMLSLISYPASNGVLVGPCERKTFNHSSAVIALLLHLGVSVEVLSSSRASYST